MLKDGNTIEVYFPIELFGIGFKTFIMREDIERMISFQELFANCILFFMWWETFTFTFFYLLKNFNIFFLIYIVLCFIRSLYGQLVALGMREHIAFANPTIVYKAESKSYQNENIARFIVEILIRSKQVDYIFIPYNPK